MFSAASIMPAGTLLRSFPVLSPLSPFPVLPACSSAPRPKS